MSEPSTEKRMEPIGAMRLVRPPSVVLCDIDDTLTDHGRVGAAAYDALWRLHDEGIRVVPVTGRPAGWCDCIVREWPVAGVVGENGAFAMYLDGEQRRIVYHPETATASSERLEALRERVLSAVPEARIASDQPFRLFDLAIDFAEDEPRYGLEVARRIHDACVGAGAVAKISSIHVNAWFGSYSKVDMAMRFLSETLGLSNPPAPYEIVFVGDSPNDSPMFDAVALSVGVASVLDYGDALDVPPAYVTRQRGGPGFVEVADAILDASRSSR